ncbi:5-oxoprolinase subunit PxpB [Sporosarcina ureilytica]|uniref:5-oxoprolinase subunit PxpB n=1 Tax=Sporosarcina ureilytica TaxID=298596 RepID=UPI00094D9C9B|nr:5-oxoprolinase subunit PxpB [Sporosarcina ureilytica]
MTYTIEPLGDQAVIIEFSNEISLNTQKQIQRITAYLDREAPSWLIEYIPAYTTLSLFYSIKQFSASPSPFQTVCNEINKLLPNIQDEEILPNRLVKIPVLYGGKYGPDLSHIATLHNLGEEEVIAIHTGGEYLVHMIGFSPGFPFIGGLSEKIATPRKLTPHLSIPGRSVGIAGKQTGIYPIETPGGWQIIGRTPVDLFLPNEEIPSLLRPGDQLQFYQISEEEYKHLRGEAT